MGSFTLTKNQTSTELLDDELGDWRDSLIEINDETIS